ncbi:tyrosine-type recombinase/integrase [Neobacillus sp. NPDC093127]|uniref:tyrosine-type recombinase/integrase n=1 Tax=Neobacillus sp. NPDC093127 TaxID=3364296 RepID=UPI00382D4C78
MKVVKTKTHVVLVDSKMKIVPEVLSYTKKLAIQGYSQNTILSYIEDLKIFYEWLVEENLSLHEIKPRHIKNFISFLDNRHKKGWAAASTVNRRLASISNFIAHTNLMGGVIVDNPFVKVEGSRASNRKKSFLSHGIKNWEKEHKHFFKRKEKHTIDKRRIYPNIAKKYLETIDELWGNESLRIRNRLIFKLLYESGMRSSEILHLQLHDYIVDDENPDYIGLIYLIEREGEDTDRQLKTGERTIHISRQLIDEIEEYVCFHRPQSGDCNYIFVSHNQPSVGEPLDYKSLYKVFKGIESVSGITNYKLSPHTLRHTHASNLADAGIDINVIKARLGHKSILTSSKYIKPSIERLSESYKNFLRMGEARLE